MLLRVDGNQRQNTHDVDLDKRIAYRWCTLDNSCIINLYNIDNTCMNEIVYHSLIWIGAGLVVYLAYNL